MNSNERAFKFQYGIRTDVGRKREENQDSHGHAHTSAASVFVVADGMGGAKGGATASAIAVDAILKNIFLEDGSVSESSIRDSLITSNQQIFSESESSDELRGMGTTAVLLAFIGERLIIGHVGDSRAYILRDGRAARLTRDHTLVQELVDSGAIGSADAANHPIAHMLTRSLGPANVVDPEVRTFAEPLRSGDAFLICCDGLYNLLSDEEIEAVLKQFDPQVAADQFIEMALERGAPDNVSVIVCSAHDIGDASVDFVIPEPNKLRLALSRDVPKLKSEERINVSAREAHEAAEEPAYCSESPEAPNATSDKKNPLDDIITTGDIQLRETEQKLQASSAKEEDLEEVEAVCEEEDAAADDDEHRREEESLRKLTYMGIGVILAVIGVLSYFVFFKMDTREAIITTSSGDASSLKPIASEAPTHTPSPVTQQADSQLANEVTSEPPNYSPGRVESLLMEVDQMRNAQEMGTIAPGIVQNNSESVNLLEEARNAVTGVLTADERNAIEAVSSQAIVSEPTLKKNYLEGEGPTTETTAVPKQKLLSSSEKAELAQKKSQLRSLIIENDLKLVALDCTSDSELQTKARAMEQKTRQMEAIALKLDELQRNLESELRMWQRRVEQSNGSDPTRLATELATFVPKVTTIKKNLDIAQEQYRETLANWNQDRKNPELVATTASLSREIKVEKTRLEVAIREAVDAYTKRTSETLIQTKLTREKLERTLDVFHRQEGSLRAIQPNAGSRNDTRIKSLLIERREAATQLRALSTAFPDIDEQKFLEDKLRSELGIRSFR